MELTLADLDRLGVALRFHDVTPSVIQELDQREAG
jgi:hypothetical protein